MPAYPVLIAVATVGWSRVRSIRLAVVLVTVAVVSSVFLFGSFLPRIPPGLG